MMYMVLALLIITIYLGIRLFYMENQVENLIKQLTDINKNKSNKKITIGLLNKKVEVLAAKINEVIEVKKQSEGSKIKLENDLRQTIANMSHDLRTPLTSIKGYIQFLKLEDITEEEKREYLSIAEQRVKALEGLLNDFYELSLIESLDYKMHLEKLHFNRILEDIILGKYADFMNINIKPNIQITKEKIYIIGEKKSLERIIENLLGNSIKYAKDNINISLKEEDNEVLLKVSNNVRDLTCNDAKNIFNRFYMADKTRSGKGTGLGLAIVKGLVEKMKGSITADLNDDVLNIYCRFEISIE